MSSNKCDGVFVEEDYISSDGMLTSVWGPSLWHSLHTISFNYPVNPTKEDKKNYYNLIDNLQYTLPCGICRKNLKNNLKKVPITMKTMKSRHTFSLWLYNLHEEVNKMLGKKSNLTYEDVRNRYEMFRARCIKTKKTKKVIKQKKEKGCTNSLYGKKSKCIINIVPVTKKCKTFKIDSECKLRK